MIIFSDLHLREETAGTVFDQVLPGIYQAVSDQKDRTVAFLGDWWHIRYQVPVRLLNRVAETLHKWDRASIRTYILPGNHDQVNAEGRNALEVLGDIPGVMVLTVPQWTTHGLWIPYRKNMEDIRKALTLKRPKGASAVLFMHHGVRGALMNVGVPDTEGVDPQELVGEAKTVPWKAILCGHYHLQQTLAQKIHYIGSPYQTKADEAGQDKGYAIWDGKKLERVNTLWGKRYHILKGVTDGSLDLTAVRPGDEVRVTTAPGTDTEEVSRVLAAAGVSHIVTPELEAQEARLNVREGEGMRAYAQEYVKTLDHGLDNTKLMQVFDEIVMVQ
jgi:DNA repair exonuclease SbcCD nuclease subunit